jgi:DNA-binding CsgD family transcriptional regulator
VIQGWDAAYPQGTEITLSEAERQALEALSRSGKAEARMQLRSRIVLMAANGAATRAISRALGCTIGTASK